MVPPLRMPPRRGVHPYLRRLNARPMSKDTAGAAAAEGARRCHRCARVNGRVRPRATGRACGTGSRGWGPDPTPSSPATTAAIGMSRIAASALCRRCRMVSSDPACSRVCGSPAGSSVWPPRSGGVPRSRPNDSASRSRSWCSGRAPGGQYSPLRPSVITTKFFALRRREHRRGPAAGAASCSFSTAREPPSRDWRSSAPSRAMAMARRCAGVSTRRQRVAGLRPVGKRRREHRAEDDDGPGGIEPDEEDGKDRHAP